MNFVEIFAGKSVIFMGSTWRHINRLAPKLFFLILAHAIYEMLIKQEPNTLELSNKLHFEEEKTYSIYRV